MKRPRAVPGLAGKLKIFISYSRRDLEIADALVESLERHDFLVTIDRRDLPYGEEWQAELADFIRSADSIVWLVSPHSVASKWCNWELGEVQRLSKRLIPVVISAMSREEIPEGLGRIHLLPSESVYDATSHLADLVAALNTDRAWVKEATRLADRARQWAAKDRNSALLLRGAALKDAELWVTQSPPSAPSLSSEILELILASRRGAARRQRWAIAGACSIALFALALASWAWAERQRATASNALAVARATEAERNYGFALEAAEKLAIGLTRDVRDFTGVRRERLRGLLARAEDVYKTLRAAGETQRLSRSESTMLQEAAATYSELGSLPQARERAERAVALLRQANATVADSAQTRRDLLSALGRLAQTLSLQGDIPQMSEVVDEMIAIWRKSLAEAPDDAGARHELAKGLQTVALYFVPSDRPRARRYFEEAAPIFQELGQKSPNVDTLLDFWNCTHDFGVLIWGEGNMSLAKDSFALLSTIGRMAIRQYPGDRRVQHSQIRSLQRFADLSSLLREPEPSANAEDEALALSRDLAAGDPDSFQAQLDLAFSLQRAARFRLDVSQRETARAAALESRDTALKLTQLDPTNSGAHEFLRSTLFYTSQILGELGEVSASLSAAEKAFEIAKRRITTDATDLRAQSGFADSLFQYVSLDKSNRAASELAAGVAILKGIKERETIAFGADQMLQTLESMQKTIAQAPR